MMAMNDTLTESLTEKQWQIAHAIANFLANEQIRFDKESDGIATELKKTVTYLYANKDEPNAGAKFFKYLEILVSKGKQVGHSGKTPEYYRSIEKASKNHLQSEQANAHTMLKILGWSARLVRYYRYNKESNQISAPTFMPQVAATDKPKLRQAETSAKYKEGQIVDAKIVNRLDKIIDPKKTKTTIDYEVDGENLEKSEEIYNIEKKGILLKVGDVVKLKIIEVKDEKIKKFERIGA